MSTSGITTRAATSADLGTVTELCVAAFDDEGSVDGTARPQRVAVVEAAGQARHPEEPHLFLSSMATLPAHRGRGAGAAMLAAGLEWARRSACPSTSRPPHPIIVVSTNDAGSTISARPSTSPMAARPCSPCGWQPDRSRRRDVSSTSSDAAAGLPLAMAGVVVVRD